MTTSKRKYCYEFSEHRQYKCCKCGRTMHAPVPHYCIGGYRKHKLIFFKQDYETDRKHTKENEQVGFYL